MRDRGLKKTKIPALESQERSPLLKQPGTNGGDY